MPLLPLSVCHRRRRRLNRVCMFTSTLAISVFSGGLYVYISFRHHVQSGWCGPCFCVLIALTIN